MKVLVVGGGSGGHITPAVAVVREIIKQRPRTKIEFWTDRKYYKNVVKITTEIGVRWGEELNKSLIPDFEKLKIDICGEFGEYHIMINDGPIFSKKIPFNFKKIYRNGNNSYLI